MDLRIPNWFNYLTTLITALPAVAEAAVAAAKAKQVFLSIYIGYLPKEILSKMS